jgi:hypothetical protein
MCPMHDTIDTESYQNQLAWISEEHSTSGSPDDEEFTTRVGWIYRQAQIAPKLKDCLIFISSQIGQDESRRSLSIAV